MKLPLPSNRVACYGPTGCGKTVLLQHLLDFYGNVVKLDFKFVGGKSGLAKNPGDLEAKNIKELVGAMREQDKDSDRPILYRIPKEHLLKVNSAQLDKVAAIAMQRRNTLLYYDDVVYVAGSADFQERAPNFYYALTVGRGLGVGVWAVSQRPARIPISVHTESDYRITFYLRRKDDRARAAESFGTDEIPWTTLRNNRFSFVVGTDLSISKPMKLEPSSGRLLVVS